MAESVTPYIVYPPIPTGVITRQPGSKCKTTADGVSTLTETYIGNFADILTSSLSVAGSAHPEFPTLVVWSNEITQEKAGIGTLVVESRGNRGGFPAPIYSIDRATHNEPLSTHPLWATQIAGTPAAPLNGAIFVDPITGAKSSATTAVFKGWTAGSSFEGIEDYLCVGCTFSASYTSNSMPDISGVGQLIDSPPGYSGTTPDGCFWLDTGASVSQQGNVYRTQYTYLLTGGVNTAATTIIYNSGV